MAPALSTFKAFSKMMACGKNGFAVRGWADKKPDPVMTALWEKIMDRPLDDRPQSILYKINLLFAMKDFPDIWFDKMKWDQTTPIDREMENQTAFFQKVASLPKTQLNQIILSYLNTIQKMGGSAEFSKASPPQWSGRKAGGKTCLLGMVVAERAGIQRGDEFHEFFERLTVHGMFHPAGGFIGPFLIHF